ncbi:MAG: HEAT repeat domain-containing protein [Myxococcales bacterium]|nr:HEAT repeat domain-containing protein [Myxococcales bacterium]
MTLRAGHYHSLAALLLILAACGSAPEPPEPRAADVPLPRRTEVNREPPPTLPPAGQLSIEESSTGLRVLANQVPRIELLRALERTLGFELELGQLADEAQAARLTLIEVDATLAEVLLAALENISFEVSYAADATRGGHLLSRVRVAGGRGEHARGKRREGRGRAERHARPDRSERRERIAARRAELPTPAERTRESAARAEEAAQRIGSDDPEERRQAAEDMGLDPDGIESLAELAANDPDPEVRAAATERLGDADSHAAVQHLLDALHDPNPLVIRTAIDQLAFTGDESIAEELVFLFDHPNPEVRVDAEEAWKFLR